MKLHPPSFWLTGQAQAAVLGPKQFAHACLAIIISQLLFWITVATAIWYSPLGNAHIKPYTVQQIWTSQATSLTDATPVLPWTKGTRTNWTEIQAPTPGLFKFNLNLKDVSGGAGVFGAYIRDSASLAVNGVSLGPPEDGDWTSRQGVLGLYFSIPPTLLKQGDNEIVLLVHRNSHFTRVGQVYAGPALQVANIARAHAFNKVTIPIIALTVCAMLAMVALSLIPLGVERTFLLSAVATAVTIGVGVLFYLDTGVVTSATSWLWYGNIIGAIGGYLAFLCLINAWIGGARWIYRACLILFAIVAIGTAIATPFLIYEAVSFMLMICVSATMLVALPASLVLLARLSLSHTKGDHWLAAALLISPTTALVDLIYSVLGEPQVVYFAPLSNLTLLLAISFALAQRGGVLYRHAERANATLTHSIAIKEAELDTSAKALRQQEAQTAIESERARIMRDMHDGMGGQLLNLLIQTRDPDVKREEMEETVETAITDLRLLIDSLDSVGDDLEIALAMFKERLGPRLTHARVALDWPSAPLGITRDLSSAEILSVYRILQEAVSNALRHGKPTWIGVRQSRDGESVLLVLDDNGVGMNANARSGRGLTNMRRRAQELGGSLEVEMSASGGVRITLLIPAVVGVVSI